MSTSPPTSLNRTPPVRSPPGRGRPRAPAPAPASAGAARQLRVHVRARGGSPGRTRRSGGAVRIGQHVVCLGDLLESLLGGRVAVDVGVIAGGRACGRRAGSRPGRPSVARREPRRSRRGSHQSLPGRHHHRCRTQLIGRRRRSPGAPHARPCPARASGSSMMPTASCRVGSKGSPGVVAAREAQRRPARRVPGRAPHGRRR